MAHISLNQYLQQVDSAWRSKNGTLAAELLSFKHPHVINNRLQLENPIEAVERVLDPPIDEITVAHMRCMWAVNNQNFMEAYTCQSMGIQSFTKAFQGMRDENWALPVMYALCLDLRLLSTRADKQAHLEKGAGVPVKESLEKAAELLMACFRICASDNRAPESESKRWGMLTLVNHLFKVYFKINKLHLCKPLIRAIESSPIKDSFSLSQKITYRYYVGRKAMFESDFKTADEVLSFAFQRCHKGCKKNKRQILLYLIPIKMLLGYMPTYKVLEKYDLLQFWEVVQALQKGDLFQLNEVLERHESFFIRCGIYLILEKVKTIAIRNLFKKVHIAMHKTHQIPVAAFLLALQKMQVPDVDMEETMCLIATLIYDGRIKGYISHQHQMVVLSKQVPFPKLSTFSGPDN